MRSLGNTSHLSALKVSSHENALLDCPAFNLFKIFGVEKNGVPGLPYSVDCVIIVQPF